jgi:hypothetical protein
MRARGAYLGERVLLGVTPLVVDLLCDGCSLLEGYRNAAG